MAIASVVLPLLLLGPAPGQGPVLPAGGLPVQNWSPEQYGARGNMIRGLVHDRAAALVWAVSEAELLCFDGARWRRHDLLPRTEYHSIALRRPAGVYVGGQNTLVVVRPGPDGRPTTIDLLAPHRGTAPAFTAIHVLATTDEALWFCDDRRLGRVDLRSGELQVLAPPDLAERPMGYFWVQASGQEVFVGSFDEGLGLVHDGAVRVLPGTEPLGKDYPVHVERRPDGSLFVVSHAGRLLRWRDGVLEDWDCAAATWAKGHALSGYAALPDGGFVLATYDAGAALCDADGGLGQVIDRSTGLQSKGVLADPSVDDQGGLWLPLGLGLARVDLKGDLVRIGAPGSVHGEVRDLCRIGERLFLVSAEGLYEVLRDVPSAHGSVVRLLTELPFGTNRMVSDGKNLLLATDKGLMRIDPDAPRIQYVAPFNAQDLCVLDDEVVLGTMVGLGTLGYAGREWGEPKLLLDADRDVRQILPDGRGRLWVRYRERDGTMVLVCLQRDGEGSWQTVEGLGGVEPDSELRLFRFRDRIHLRGSEGVFALDEAGGHFERVTDLPRIEESVAVVPGRPRFPASSSPRQPLAAGADWIWYLDDDDVLQLALRDQEGTWRKQEAVLPFPSTRVAFTHFEEDHGWIGTVRGELLLWRRPGTFQSPPLGGLRLRWIGANRDLCLYGGLGTMPAVLTPLPFRHGTLKIAFALGSFVRSDRNRYRSSLGGLDPGWTEWTPDGERDFTGLAEGSYLLEIQARDAFGRIAVPITLAFEVLPPWYRSSLAFLVYALLVAGGISGLVHWRVRRERRRVALLEQEVQSRKQAEAALEVSRSRYRALVETTSDLVWEMDRSLVYRYASPRYADQLGLAPDEVVGRSLLDLVVPEDRDRVRAQLGYAIETGTAFAGVGFSMFDRAGAIRRLESSGEPILDDGGRVLGFRGIDRDVTERHRAEEERRTMAENLQQAGKLESLGRLAGGVAHDFNNILTAILGHAELVRDEIGRHPTVDPEAQINVAEILRSGRRASDLTSQLLAFSRRQVLRPRILDPNQVISSMERMLERLVREDIELHLDLDPEVGAIEVDGGQLEQVLLNFVVNAVDAMPRGGDLVISTGRRRLDAAYVRRHPEASPGLHCEIAIRDTGTGMDAETRRRIFEPFYTTKPGGKGTGLGLATALGIVQQSGGHIVVDSRKDKGTTFRALFPVVEAEPTAEVAPAPPGIAGGSERILLVDDDSGVRSVAARTLEA